MKLINKVLFLVGILISVATINFFILVNFQDNPNNSISIPSEQSFIQILWAIDIAIFFIVLFVIRQSLIPIQKIATGLEKIREGIYGEIIDYHAKDEVGQLVTNFNIMSNSIKEKQEKAKTTEKSKDEFLAMITHELKTPLVPIRGYADILLNGHLGSLTYRQKARLEIIKNSSASLLEIISDLLDVQKLELGQLRIKKEKQSLKKTIEGAIETLQPNADEKNIKIIYSGDDVILNHDPERINQVLTNLIKNSLSFVKPKSGAIQIQLDQSFDTVKISVIDNGSGIEKEKQKELFKKFYQVDSSLTRERGGSGLGLAICKGIIEGHGGKIEITSNPNVKTTFSFTIPKESSD